VAALTDFYGKGNVGVIHFDAHYDAGKYMQGHLSSHGDVIKEAKDGPDYLFISFEIDNT